MAQMLKVARRRRAFERADILSLMGETICGVERQMSPPKVVKVAPGALEAAMSKMVAACLEEEDPERWDGMS